LRDIFSIHSSEQTAFFELRRYFGIIITHSFSFVNIFLSFFDNFFLFAAVISEQFFNREPFKKEKAVEK